MAKQTPSTSGFKSAALSDQGVRSNNEDLVYNDDDRGIYFVVDGMGGHAAGEQAARIAGERLRGRLERPTGSPQQRIREAIALANNAIFESAAQNPDWKGMACVLTVALVTAETATVGHVGDSRLYKISGGNIEKVTRDHSPVGELEDGQQLSEAEAMAHPRRNEVYRDVGSALHDPNDADFIDIYEVAIEPEGGLLICSDGLTDALPLADIRKIIRDHAQDPAAAVQSLIRKAKARDAKDNISVVLVEGQGFAHPKRTVPPASEITQQHTAELRPVVISRAPESFWRRLAWALLWIMVGAALTFGVQQILQQRLLQGWLAPAPPNPASEAPARKPATILVKGREPGSPLTIAAAVSAANDGDTIELAPGVYDEPVRIEKNNLLIEGSGALLRLKPTTEGSDGITIAGAAGIRLQNLRILGDADGNLLTGIHLVDSQVTLHNVAVADAAGAGIETGGQSVLKMEASSVRDCSGPGLLLRGAVAATLRYSEIVGNGREAGDRQPGIMMESTLPVTLIGNTIANNGGPAIVQPGVPSQEMLKQNFFSLDGRTGRLDDVRVIRKRAPRK